MSPWRKRKLPDGVAAATGLARGEHVLTWAADDEGRNIVATESDLILQRRPPAYERVGWESIDTAGYADGVLTLTLVPPEPGGDAARLRIQVRDSEQLAIVVRDRVTSSIVVNEHIALDGRKGLRVVARRRAGEQGLRWGYVVDSGVDVDAELREEAQRLVQQVRLQSGID